MALKLTQTSFLTALTVLVAIAGMVAGARLVFGIQNGLRNGFRMQWDNAWLITAYLLFMFTSGFQVGRSGLLFRYIDEYRGWIPMHERWEKDGLQITKLFFFETTGLSLSLWFVKFSLLSLYNSLMAQVPSYTRLWWAVVIYCICASHMFKMGSFPSDDVTKHVPSV